MNTKACMCSVLLDKAITELNANNEFELQKLPYADNALEPFISEQTIQFHYGKHLPAYITNLNNLKKGGKLEKENLCTIVKESEAGLYNNAAQVYNHYFYFLSLCAASDKAMPSKIKTLIEKNFESIEKFKELFTQAGMTLFGSGWVWLIQDGEKLEILQTPNAVCPIVEDKHPLLTLDVWEHAYYLDTQNARAKYIENFWNIVNWEKVESRLM